MCMFMLVLFDTCTGQSTQDQFSESSGALEPIGTSEIFWKNFTIDCDPQVSSSECDSWTLNQIAENATDTNHMNIEIKHLSHSAG